MLFGVIFLPQPPNPLPSHLPMRHQRINTRSKPRTKPLCRPDPRHKVQRQLFRLPPDRVAHAGVDVGRGEGVGQAAAVAGGKAMGVMS